MSYQAPRVKAPDRRQPAITEDIKAAGLDWITALRAPAIKERRRKVPRWRVRCAASDRQPYSARRMLRRRLSSWRSDFAPLVLSLLRETEGSNPAPSSRESVSLRNHFQRSKTPSFRTAVRGWLGDRVGRDAQGVSISRQPAAISRRAIFQYRSAADWVGKNAMPVPTKL